MRKQSIWFTDLEGTRQPVNHGDLIALMMEIDAPFELGNSLTGGKPNYSAKGLMLDRGKLPITITAEEFLAGARHK